jgi:hypothetical protein
MENLVWLVLIVGFAAYIGGPGGAVALLVVSVAIVALIAGCAALLDWREARSKRRSHRRS